jgi:hypothetical protein
MVVRWYYLFFQFCTMGKMVISSMYIIWKNFPADKVTYLIYNNIILYISDNTHILTIPPMNTTHTTLKKTGGIELISTIGSLHIGLFLLHTSPFQPVVHGGIVYRKKPLLRIIALKQYKLTQHIGST